MGGDGRQNIWFAAEATRGMSDQLWGSPSLAKSRIGEFMVHMWKFLHRQILSFCLTTSPDCSGNPADLKYFKATW